ncbi:MAG: hypothetical protein R2822_15060 [Spirosomataceae bacterium]
MTVAPPGFQFTVAPNSEQWASSVTSVLGQTSILLAVSAEKGTGLMVISAVVALS